MGLLGKVIIRDGHKLRRDKCPHHPECSAVTFTLDVPPNPRRSFCKQDGNLGLFCAPAPTTKRF